MRGDLPVSRGIVVLRNPGRQKVWRSCAVYRNQRQALTLDRRIRRVPFREQYSESPARGFLRPPHRPFSTSVKLFGSAGRRICEGVSVEIRDRDHQWNEGVFHVEVDETMDPGCGDFAFRISCVQRLLFRFESSDARPRRHRICWFVRSWAWPMSPSNR